MRRYILYETQHAALTDISESGTCSENSLQGGGRMNGKYY